jgi:hypothetical protein
LPASGPSLASLSTDFFDKLHFLYQEACSRNLT